MNSFGRRYSVEVGDDGSLPAGEFLDTRQVEQFARLSYATLKRRHQEGHDTGLRKRGRRVLFHVPTLTTFLLGKPAGTVAN